jgi:hypothetical protein
MGNPIITSIFTADPSARVWPSDPDRLYVYASQDIFPASGCSLMDRYHIFSTDNMTDWIDHGEFLRRDDLPEDVWGPHHSDAFFMWAPDAAYNPDHPEGKGPYFFYFPHSTGDTTEGPSGWGANWVLGVAWSDRPCGGFKGSEAVMLRDVDGNVIRGGGELIDPNIFEEDGVYYMIVGGSQQCRIARLKPCMTQLDEPWTILTNNNRRDDIPIDPEHYNKLPYFHEGPWMFTRETGDGLKLYYLMHPGTLGEGGSSMVYSVSTEGPYGPWQYKGAILDPVGTGDTSHGSVVEFKGKWYLFYHNAALSGGIGNLRSSCVDELFFNPDGSIQKVIQTTESVPPIGPPADPAVLDAKFGAGNWRIEEKFRGLTMDGHEGYVLDQKYSVMDDSVIVVGANKQSNTGAVHNMHISGSYVEFTGVSGGNGGKALLQLEYGTPYNAAIQVTAGGNSYFFHCPSTSGWETFRDNAYLLIELAPGDNTIRLGGGAMNIRSISILFGQ